MNARICNDISYYANAKGAMGIIMKDVDVLAWFRIESLFREKFWKIVSEKKAGGDEI